MSGRSYGEWENVSLYPDPVEDLGYEIRKMEQLQSNNGWSVLLPEDEEEIEDEEWYTIPSKFVEDLRENR